MKDYKRVSRYEIHEAVDHKYLYLNAFDEGYRLPDEINDVIGYGAKSPLAQVRDYLGHKDIGLAVGYAKKNSDIHMSLSTPLGTRFMNPDFGSKLYSLLFEPYDDFLIKMLRLYTIDAITKDVRKVKVEIVNIDTSLREMGLLQISIRYYLRNTNVPGNYVYPFVHLPEPTRF